MRHLEVVESITIKAPATQVRDQFGDVAHHAASAVHKGVTFEVLDDDGTVCNYTQTTRVGPLRLNQQLQLVRSGDALVNHVQAGQFAGGTITFTINPASDSTTSVEARISAPLRAHEALVAPLLRRKVKRALSDALVEDRSDIESGTYGAQRS